jgi:hypothetical protein
MNTDNKIKTTMNAEKEFLYKDMTKEILDCAFNLQFPAAYTIGPPP